MEELFICNLTPPGASLALAEGLALTAYQFEGYKTDEKSKAAPTLRQLTLVGPDLSTEKVAELDGVLQGVYLARDLVNMPYSHLNATQLAQQFEQAGDEAGFDVEILDFVRIEALRMGGLLAVNQGSPEPPTFTIMEYKPEGATNAKPIVLVGKGVVFDTGGLSLKPTPNSMDLMKCDMGGSAVVVGVLTALAKNKVPLHVIGLVPATDNRPGGPALAPGDVITMYSGLTVEVLNTDAEGRLILADALAFAKKYDPELVMDYATLTGSAARAIGIEGIVYMGTADEQVMADLKKGWQHHPRATGGISALGRVRRPHQEPHCRHDQPGQGRSRRHFGRQVPGALRRGLPLGALRHCRPRLPHRPRFLPRQRRYRHGRAPHV